MVEDQTAEANGGLQTEEIVSGVVAGEPHRAPVAIDAAVVLEPGK